MPAQYPRGRIPNRVFGVGGQTTEDGLRAFQIGRSVCPRGQSPGTGLFLSRKSKVTYAYIGVTRTGAGVALPNCDVYLFESHTKVLVGQARSDGSGNFSIPVPNDSTQYFLVAFIEGSPDLAGVTNRDTRGS